MASKRQKIADKDRYSIIVPDFKHCMVCGTSQGICIHEVFFGVSARMKSIEDGCCVPLCRNCHQGTNGVHNNRTLDLALKKQAEKIWIKTYCEPELSPEEKIKKFVLRFGMNYLDSDEI